MKKMLYIILLLIFGCHCFLESHIDGYEVSKEKKTIVEQHRHSEEVIEFCTSSITGFTERKLVNILTETSLQKDDYFKIWKPPVII